MSTKGRRPSGLAGTACSGRHADRSIPGKHSRGVGGGRSGRWPGGMHDLGQHGRRHVRRLVLVDPARGSSWMSWRGRTRQSRRADQAPKPHSLGRVSGGPCTGARGVCRARYSAWGRGRFGGAPQDLPPARGGCASGSALADHGNGVLTGISGSHAGPVCGGRQPAGRVTARAHTVGDPATGSAAGPESTRGRVNAAGR